MTGLKFLLCRVEAMLTCYANDIFVAHTVNGVWPDSEIEAKGAHDELRQLARGLRMATRYYGANPLGGPATMFDAIADRLRVGEALDAVLADYGLQFTPKEGQ